VWIDYLQEGVVDSWKERQTGLATAPFFRAR
jgi:hypothetical protein